METFHKNKILNNVIGKLIFETGAGWLEPYVRRRILNKLKNRHVDVVWSDQCVFLGRATTSELRCQTNYMVTYAIDDPFWHQRQEQIHTVP
jgi:hypothetical protein